VKKNATQKNSTASLAAKTKAKSKVIKKAKKAKNAPKQKAEKKKEQSLDDIISEQYDDLHSDNNVPDNSEPSGFIGRHMKKIADK